MARISKKISKQITRILQSIFFVGNIGQYKIFRLLGVILFRIDRVKKVREMIMSTPVDPNMIVFCDDASGNYTCNPKYIMEEMIRQHLPYKLVYILPKKRFPLAPCSGVELVDMDDDMACIRKLAEARVWISNGRKTRLIQKGLIKKDTQIYIQTWHGSFGIKKIGDIDGIPKTQERLEWLDLVKKEGEMIDVLLSNSKFDDTYLWKGICSKDKLRKLGHPRCDVFFLDDEKKKRLSERVHSALKIDKDAKIVAYVPTFRDDGRTDCFDLDTDVLRAALEKKFGGKWAVAIKLHPKIPRRVKMQFLFGDLVVDACQYVDCQELLSVCDCCVSDYSSCIFDFLLVARPAIVYAPDVRKFLENRGVFGRWGEFPFFVAESLISFVSCIGSWRVEEWQHRVQAFLMSRECVEFGESGKKTLGCIKNLMLLD